MNTKTPVRPITTTFTTEFLAALDAHCAEHGGTRASVIEALCRPALGLGPRPPLATGTFTPETARKARKAPRRP